MTGPKRFLIERWHDPDLVRDAAVFFDVTTILQFIITLPDAMKLKSTIAAEVQSALPYEPMRLVSVGAVVYASWRLVGGSARAWNTFGAFAYAYSVTSLLLGCTMILSTGILRAWAPAVVDDLMRGIMGGRIVQAIDRSSDFFNAHPWALLLHLLTLGAG